MNKKSLSLIILILSLSLFGACSKKKDKLVSNSALLSIDPANVQRVYAGGQVSFTSISRNSKSEVIDITPVWTIDSGIGTLSAASGKTVVYSAPSSPVMGKIYATFEDLRASVTCLVRLPGTLYDGIFATWLDAPGVFVGGGTDSVTLASDLDKFFGTGSFKATFTVGAASWAGWYVSSSSERDMSAYAAGHLKFNIKTAYNIQIGIRSGNIASGTNTAKVYINAYITPSASQWQEVSIPINDLTSLQAGFNLARMKDMFITAVIGATIGAQTNQTYLIDNIRWTTD